MPAAVDFSATTTGSAPRGSRKYLQIFILTEDTLPKRAAAEVTDPALADRGADLLQCHGAAGCQHEGHHEHEEHDERALPLFFSPWFEQP